MAEAGMRAVTLVLAMVLLLGLMSAVSIDRAHAAVGKPIRWMFHGGPGGLAVATDAKASRLLDNTRPLVLRRRNAFAIPPGWNAVPIAPFQSFRAISDAFEQNTLIPGVNGILYDYERWKFTPEEEKRNPAPYVKQAAALVPAHGLLFVTSPALNLVTVLAPGGKRDDATLFDTYLRLGIAADAARYADVVVIQAQRGERNAELYADFVRQAAAQARQANPKVAVFAGVSTNPLGRHVTADDILRDIAATRDIVEGYWLNIPPHTKEYRPDIAIDVLRRVARQ
jgi:hypothetical protein